MLVQLDKPQVLSKAIDIISELVMEVKIKVNDFGLSVVAIDPANVAMVEFKLPKSAFSRFETVGPEDLGINLDNLKRNNQIPGRKETFFHLSFHRCAISQYDRFCSLLLS